MGTVVLKNCSSGGLDKTPAIFRDVAENISPYVITANDLEGLKSIKPNAFFNKSVKKIIIPATVDEVGYFYNCPNIEEITFNGGSFSSTGLYFSDCPNLKTINLYPSVTTFNPQISNCPNFSKLNFVGSIEEWCSAPELTYTLPQNVLYINNSLVQGTININNVTSIKRNAFFDCSDITAVDIQSDSGVSISQYAFFRCQSLVDLYVSRLSSVDALAFDACTSLSNIYYGNTVADWCSIDKEFMACNDLPKTLYVNYGSQEETKIEGLLTIPDGVRSISKCAFRCCDDITSISFPSTTTVIWERAFQKCNGLTSLIIPSTLTRIDHNAFSGCSNLTSVTLQEGVSQINAYAFAETGITSISIPSSLNEIYFNVFYRCGSLKSVYLKNTITRIHYNAFAYCVSLENIYYDGTMSDWGNVSKTADWDYNTGNYVIHCTDGDIPKQ